MGGMTIGELAARTGLSVRTLRFYADAGVLPEAGRTEAGYRLFAADAVARARLVRTLRELGVGLQDVKRVLAADVSLAEVATAHASAIDAQIRTLRLQLAVLRAVARSTEPKELELMTYLTKLTVEERRRILDDYLDAVFDGEPNPVADRLRLGAPDLPDDPSAEQVAAWVELVELLRDPHYIEASRRMVGPGRIEAAEPEGVQLPVEALSERVRCRACGHRSCLQRGARGDRTRRGINAGRRGPNRARRTDRRVYRPPRVSLLGARRHHQRLARRSPRSERGQGRHMGVVRPSTASARINRVTQTL